MIGRLNGLDPAAPPLAFSHSSQIEGELRELRRSDNLFVLLPFTKRSRAVSDTDLRIARERWDDFQERIGADRRRPPRPPGHDALTQTRLLPILVSWVGREPPMTSHSPIGTPASTAAARRRATNPAYTQAADAVAIFEQLARIIIRHRTQQGLSQETLAQRIGTSHSAISRLESGQHACRPDTLARVADGLGIRLVIGFESGPTDNPTRELVTT